MQIKIPAITIAIWISIAISLSLNVTANTNCDMRFVICIEQRSLIGDRQSNEQ